MEGAEEGQKEGSKRRKYHELWEGTPETTAPGHHTQDRPCGPRDTSLLGPLGDVWGLML